VVSRVFGIWTNKLLNHTYSFIIIIPIDWRKIKPDVLTILSTCKTNRLAKERKQFLKQRRDTFDKAYKSHQSTLPPSTWVDLPPTWALQDVQPFSELLMEPTDRVLEKSDFTEVLKASVDEIKQVWRSDQRNRMGGMIPPSTQSSLGSPSQADSDSADEITNIPPPPPAPVDLATSVFYCPGCVKRYKYTSNTFLINPCYVGWEQACIHLTCDLLHAYGHRQLGFSEVGQRVAKALIRMMGLDPKRAMPRETEVLDRRFFCGGCLEGMDGDQGVDEGQRVLTWTECVRIPFFLFVEF
jgi:hypothetical protein